MAVRRLLVAPAAAVDLAALRIAVFLALIAQALLWQGSPSWFAALPEALRVPPAGWRALGGLPFASPLAVTALEAIFVAACVLAALGWFTRVTTLLATGLGLYLLGLPQAFGKLNHYHHLLWLAALLAASPCGDAWSLDRRRRGATEPAADAAYGLPLRLAWVLIGALYLFPGLWKLFAAPAGWLSGRDLVGHLHAKWHELESFRPSLPIDQWPWLARGLSWFTLAFEIGFLPFVLWRRTRRWAVATGLLFHAGTTLTMRISFLPLVVCYVAFVDWGALRSKLRPRVTAGEGVGTISVPSLTPRPATIVGAILVAAAALAGAFGHDGWPFAVYPRFHYRPAPVVPVLRAERQLPADEPLPVGTPEFVDKLHSSRWAAIARSLATPAPSPEHTRRVLAVSRLYLEDGLRPPLRPCERFVLYLDLDRTDPAAAGDNPLQRRVLRAVERRPPEGCPQPRQELGATPQVEEPAGP